MRSIFLMINRYDINEVSNSWNEHAKFTTYENVELATLKALGSLTIIPSDVAEKYNQVSINVDRINELEAQVHHDVIAFTTSITEQVDTSAAKYFHFGCTSSDIIDTALSLQIKESLEIELKDLDALISSLWNKALATKELYTLGRSHGMYA